MLSVDVCLASPGDDMLCGQEDCGRAIHTSIVQWFEDEPICPKCLTRVIKAYDETSLFDGPESA